MAPEVIESEKGYDFSADIWSLGITAIELANGEVPQNNKPAMSVLLSILKNPPPQLDSSKFSKNFVQFVNSCLNKDATKRLTAEKLLQSKFITAAQGKEYIKEKFIQEFPDVEER